MTNPANSTKPIVAIGSMGGTIAMAPASEGAGVSPTLGADELIAAVPEIAEIAEIHSRSICNVGSPSMTFGHLLEALQFARDEVDAGAAGVVLTHGTDTLEESAFLLDLLWDRPEPLVFTGAMRSAEEAGAEGPANLLAAVITAATPALRDYGVLVALDDEVHLAATVTKSHANALWTFKSPDWGPVARIVENRARVRMAPVRRLPALPTPASIDGQVPIFEMGLEDDGRFITADVAAGLDAFVMAGAGTGHVTVKMAEALGNAVAAGVPVILCTRQGSGTTTVHTYDYPGSEMDLLQRGVLAAGYLSPRKARILALVLTANGASMDDIRRELDLRGE